MSPTWDAASTAPYSSIQKVDDQIYLSGSTTYFLRSVASLKRCDIEGQVLKCVELEPERTNGTPALELAVGLRVAFDVHAAKT